VKVVCDFDGEVSDHGGVRAEMIELLDITGYMS
jgi:hypothetical protein